MDISVSKSGCVSYRILMQVLSSPDLPGKHTVQNTPERTEKDGPATRKSVEDPLRGKPIKCSSMDTKMLLFPFLAIESFSFGFRLFSYRILIGFRWRCFLQDIPRMNVEFKTGMNQGYQLSNCIHSAERTEKNGYPTRKIL